MPLKIVKPIRKRANRTAIHPALPEHWRCQTLLQDSGREPQWECQWTNSRAALIHTFVFTEFTITTLHFVKVCELVFNGCIGYLLTPMCRLNTLEPSCQIHPGSLSLTWLCEEAEQRWFSLPLSRPAIPSLFHSLFLSFTLSVSILLPYSLSLWKSMQNAL